MHNYEKEVEFAKLADEKKELETLKKIYQEAADKVQKQLKVTNGKIDVMLSELDDLDEGTLSVLRSQIYHKGFQDNLSRQLNGFLNELNRKQYKSIEEYLKASYETGFVGAMYSIANQGIPLIVPIDQKKVVQAIKLNPKLNKDMYTKLGHDVDTLKKRIIGDISRGIAFSDTYDNIARNINNDTRVGFNNAMRVVRTEGHRVQIESAYDAMVEAKSKGADVVKQWNAILDGRTRPHHRLLDGQIRELDEPFELNGIEVRYPGAFGRPEEDINCRCILSQRAKWNLDEEELETLKERAAYHGLEIEKKQGADARKSFDEAKVKDFKDFRKKYLKAVEDEFYRNKNKTHRKIGSKGQQIIDKATYQKLTTKFVKYGGIIIRGEEAAKHLGDTKLASYLPSLNTAFIRDDATVSDVLEEMRHAEQDRINMFGAVLTEEVRLRREIEAQKYLLSVSDRYKIPIEEIELTKANLKEYEKDLAELLAKGE